MAVCGSNGSILNHAAAQMNHKPAHFHHPIEPLLKRCPEFTCEFQVQVRAVPNATLGVKGEGRTKSIGTNARKSICASCTKLLNRALDTAAPIGCVSSTPSSRHTAFVPRVQPQMSPTVCEWRESGRRLSARVRPQLVG